MPAIAVRVFGILVLALLGNVIADSTVAVHAQPAAPGVGAITSSPTNAGGAAPRTPVRRATKSDRSSKKVLILFDQGARHIDLVVTVRKGIEQVGGRVRAVIGLAGIIADIEPGSTKELSAAKGVQTVYDNTVTPPPGGDLETLAAVAAWNRVRSGTAPATRPPAGGALSGGPPTDMLEPTDLPRDTLQQRAIESEYRGHWQELQHNLPPRLQRSRNVGCGTNGAGYFDTSLYLAGDIAVGVFYIDGVINGNPTGWTQTGSVGTASTTQTFADIVHSLDQFLDIQPNARLTFTYTNEVDGSGNPLSTPPNQRTYVNDLRNTWCTDWAYLISVQNGGPWPNADLNGPSVRLDRTFTYFDNVVRHETGHIFGAGDQYAPNGLPATRYGYLMAAHANGCGNDGTGFFPDASGSPGAGECLDDLMNGWSSSFGYNSIIGPYTAGQLGWHASDGSGALDLTKTKPVIDATSVVHVTSGSALTYSGVAFDRPPLNQSASYGNVSINRIIAVQYQINAAAWQDAAPADGVFDSVSEGFSFTTPSLPNGTYTIRIRAINTVGAVSPLPYAEQIVITSSSVSNTRPFGSLTVTPERAKFGTVIKASGVASRDLEPGPLTYNWKWGNGLWSGWSSSPVSTKTFGASDIGPQTVQMRVKDVLGLTHLISRSITVAAYDTAPLLVLRAVVENRHFTSGPNYSLSLSVAGSHDAETPFAGLTVEWDDECNGNWASGPKIRTLPRVNSHFSKSDRRCVAARMTDGGLNVVTAKRFVWVVPYNHQPTLPASAVTFVLSGADYIVTVNATDADISTQWDGMLEYRFDYEGDGIWDTKFDPNPSITLPAAYRNTVIIEVKDRLHGRAIWAAASCAGAGGPFSTC